MQLPLESQESLKHYQADPGPSASQRILENKMNFWGKFECLHYHVTVMENLVSRMNYLDFIGNLNPF